MNLQEEITALIARHNVYHQEEPTYMLNTSQLADQFLQLINRIGEDVIGDDYEVDPDKLGHYEANEEMGCRNWVNAAKLEARQRLSLLTGKDNK